MQTGSTNLIITAKSMANSNVLVLSGVGLVLFGLSHIVVWMILGGNWEGDVSWRKPILFGISTGMTLSSLGWIYNKLPRQPFDQPIAWGVSLSMVFEVGLITIQQWRGVASHFNQDTVADAWIDGLMFYLICVAVAGIFYFAYRSFHTLNTDSDYVLAIRAGLLFLIVSCLIGFVISGYGYQRRQAGLDPGIYGERGVMKFPHGVVIHALQLFPLAVWCMRRIKISSRRRVMVVQLLAISLFFQLAFACLQTANGLARLELTSWDSILLGTASVITLFYAGLIACLGIEVGPKKP